MKRNSRRNVLYDVIAKDPAAGRSPDQSARSLRVPGWWKNQTAAPSDAAPVPGDGDSPGDDDRIHLLTRLYDGRIVIALSQVGQVITCGSLCALLLAAFLIGRRTVGTLPTQPPAMAALSNDGSSDALARTDGNEGAAGARRDDLEALMTPPNTLAQKNGAEKGAASPAGQSGDSANGARLRHLRIESITAKNDTEWQRAEIDARLIQDFLKQQGILTTLQKVNNGWVVVSQDGFADTKAAGADRDAFRQRIVEFGKLYRKSGGRYSFKGCYYP